MDIMDFKELLWLFFWCLTFPASFLCWKHVYMNILIFGIKTFSKIPWALPFGRLNVYQIFSKILGLNHKGVGGWYPLKCDFFPSEQTPEIDFLFQISKCLQHKNEGKNIEQQKWCYDGFFKIHHIHMKHPVYSHVTCFMQLIT